VWKEVGLPALSFARLSVKCCFLLRGKVKLQDDPILCSKLIWKERKVRVEGVLGKTDEMVFIQKAGSGILLMFDDHVFDSVALEIKAAKAAQVKSSQKRN